MVPSNFRLGYACICTELRKQNIFSSRTLRLSTLKAKTNSFAKELATQNLKDLLTMLEWNKKNDIYFMRLSSEIFPFAVHEEYGYSLDFADTLLKQIGNYAKENKMRLTMHPAQFNVLSSPSQKVVENSIKDLNHHCDILDRMGLDQDSVMIIHGGGVYNDKKKSIQRFKENFKKLPENTQKRLVIENCEMAYKVEDLLEISEELDIPMVLDFHHDDLNRSTNQISSYYDRVFSVWNKRGIKPKVHVSNSIPGISETDTITARRKHSDYIKFFHKELLKITFPIDVMLECKMKEQAILQLRKVSTIESLESTPEESWSFNTIDTVESKLEYQESLNTVEPNININDEQEINLCNDFKKLELKNVLKHSKTNHKKNILKETSLKNAHIYCKINKLSGQVTGPLIEMYIKEHYKMNKNNASLCVGDLQYNNTNIELKVSNGGKENNKFNYVQIRLNHKCDYILTAYYINEKNINDYGELFIFKLNKDTIKNMIEKYGGYAHGTVKKLGQIKKEDLNDPNNNKEYALRTKYGDKCWNALLEYRIKDI